jgi:uncharacterized protein
MLSFVTALANLTLQAKPTEFVVFLNEANCGTYTFQDSKSKVESVFNVKFGSTAISNTLNITYKDKEVSDFRYLITTTAEGKQTSYAQIDFSGGKAQVRQTKDGKPTEVPVMMVSPVWANYHPSLFARVIRSLDSKKTSPQKINGTMIDRLVPLDLSISLGHLSEKLVNGKPMKYALHDLTGSVQAKLAVSEDGSVLGMDVPTQKFRIVQKGAESIFVDPLARYPELSQPTYGVKVEERVDIRLKDGTLTKATIVSPDKPGKYPTILTRTPYGRSVSLTDATMYAKRGYVFVSQDVRGTGESQGTYDPFMTEQGDGDDTIDWISKQSWSNEKVGMIGASYGGLVQWSAASLKHPALKCIVPQVSPPASAMWNLPYENGTFMLLGSIWWLRIVDGPRGTDLTSYSAPVKMSGMTTLPLSQADNAVLGFNSKTFDAWLTRDRTSKWKGWDFENLMKTIKTPALHISGWYDGDAIGTQRNFELLTKSGNKNQWLIYGPWPHAFNTSTKLGDVDFGSSSQLELESLYLRWFDTWLKEKKVGLDRVPKVKFFTMGENKWHQSSTWPPAEAKPTVWGLDFKEKRMGQSVAKSSTNSFLYDPSKDKVDAKEVTLGSTETMFMKGEKDSGKTLTVKSAKLREAMTIAGPLEVEFTFNSSAKDTDFFVSFFDEDEKGRWFYFVGSAKQRASYLSGNDQPKSIVPGKTYRMKMRSWDTSHQLKKGHRLVVLISSSQFPQMARNLGTGEPIGSSTKMVKQRNTLISTPKQPAFVRFYSMKAN